jgi:hypothetical protein
MVVAPPDELPRRGRETLAWQKEPRGGIPFKPAAAAAAAADVGEAKRRVLPIYKPWAQLALGLLTSTMVYKAYTLLEALGLLLACLLGLSPRSR